MKSSTAHAGRGLRDQRRAAHERRIAAVMSGGASLPLFTQLAISIVIVGGSTLISGLFVYQVSGNCSSATQRDTR